MTFKDNFETDSCLFYKFKTTKINGNDFVHSSVKLFIACIVIIIHINPFHKNTVSKRNMSQCSYITT